MKKNNVLILIFIIVTLIAVVTVLLFTTVFVVKDISVENSVQSDIIVESRIISASGLRKGKSIISINKSSVIASIEKANPYVKVVGVEREFPDSIVIKVALRQALMCIMTDDANCLIVDGSLKVLEVLPSNAVFSTPATSVSGYVMHCDAPASQLLGTTIAGDGGVSTLLCDLVTAASDPALDLGGNSFLAFFKSIRFEQDADTVRAFIRTNTGVVIVLDNSLTSPIYNQLYMCMTYYTGKAVTIDRTAGYIYFDGTSYVWKENYKVS